MAGDAACTRRRTIDEERFLIADNDIHVRERDLDGRPLFVVDGMLRPDFVRMLFEVLNRQGFTRSDYDTDATKGVRHWKHEFSLDDLTSNPFLRTWHDHVVAKTNELFPGRKLALRRVHINNHPYGDLQHAHVDWVPGVTALYFANTHWDENWHGETIFYDGGGEAYYAVAPKPGRILIFAGDVLHRGGVPSRTCFESRLSVAFKFSADA